MLEVLLALLIFIGIVWWTMFSGRSNGELIDTVHADIAKDASAKVVHQTNHQHDNHQPPVL